MHLPSQAQRVRIYIGEQDHQSRKPLYEAIVEEARSRGLAGATVFRGLAGFGAHSRIKTSKILALSEDLPLVVEIVDTAEKLEPFLDWLDDTVEEGLVTLEPVEVRMYRAGKS